MMNSPLVEEASRQLAQRLEDFPEKQQITQLYKRALGRLPSKTELSTARRYLKQFLVTPVVSVSLKTESGEEAEVNEDKLKEPMTLELQALKLLCHSILASNEFIYIK